MGCNFYGEISINHGMLKNAINTTPCWLMRKMRLAQMHDIQPDCLNYHEKRVGIMTQEREA